MSELPSDNMEHDDWLSAWYRAAAAGTEPSPALDDAIRAAPLPEHGEPPADRRAFLVAGAVIHCSSGGVEHKPGYTGA